MDIIENLFYGGMFVGLLIGMALMTVIFLIGLTLSDRKENKMGFDLDEEELKSTRKLNGADKKKETKEDKEKE